MYAAASEPTAEAAEGSSQLFVHGIEGPFWSPTHSVSVSKKIKGSRSARCASRAWGDKRKEPPNRPCTAKEDDHRAISRNTTRRVPAYKPSRVLSAPKKPNATNRAGRGGLEGPPAPIRKGNPGQTPPPPSSITATGNYPGGPEMTPKRATCHRFPPFPRFFLGARACPPKKKAQRAEPFEGGGRARRKVVERPLEGGFPSQERPWSAQEGTTEGRRQPGRGRHGKKKKKKKK